MHTNCIQKTCFTPNNAAAKRPLRRHAPRAGILRGTKLSVTSRCEKRRLKINYVGTGNNSAFTYDPLGHMVKIVETVSGTITGTKQFVWAQTHLSEERDATGSSTKKFYGRGEVQGTNQLYYTRDHLLSVREVTDSSGTMQCAYAYDPFGNVNKLFGSADATFQFTGCYKHQASGLNATLNRFYQAHLARWLNRDPIEERGGVNLYAYVNNQPTMRTDLSGLAASGVSGGLEAHLFGGGERVCIRSISIGGNCSKCEDLGN